MTCLTSLRLRLRASLPVLILASLGAPPAAAIITLNGADPQMALKEGARLKNVVGLTAKYSNSDLKCNWTGVFLGYGKDGKTGYVLTAASMLDEEDLPGKDMKLRSVDLFFADWRKVLGEAEAWLNIPASKAFIHPERECYVDLRDQGDKEEPTPYPMVRNDLAILAFDASQHRKTLDELKVRPTALYEGKAHLKTEPLFEKMEVPVVLCPMAAQVAGVGFPGAHDDETLSHDCMLRAGRTHVSYGTWRGWTGFLSLTLATGTTRQTAKPEDPFANVLAFRALKKGKFITGTLGGDLLVKVGTLPDQAVPAVGDAGGPLSLQDGDEPRLAAINTGCHWDTLVPLGKKTPTEVAVHVWEPLQNQKAWIEGVMAGKGGTAKTLDAGQVKPKASKDVGKKS